MIEFLLTHLLPVVGSIAIGVAGWVGWQLVQFVRTRTQSDEAALFSEHVRQGALDSVAWVGSQLKSGVVEVARDGQVTPTEAQRLQELAIAKLREWLGVHGPERAERLIGIAGPALQEWLRGVVQRAFAQYREQTKK